MVKVEEKFSSFIKTEHFIRVDHEHKLELLIGLDTEGRKAIKLRGDFIPNFSVKGTKAITIEHFKKDDVHTVQFSLNDESVLGLFYVFCNDIIECSRDADNTARGYQKIIERYNKWKKMFIRSDGNCLSEQEIMGLIGELLFLQRILFPKYGEHIALNGWSGQELTHKDFSYDDMWYEVKAIIDSSSFVSISSLEQLESNRSGYLIVYKLEKMSRAFRGTTLNRLVLEIFNAIKNEEDRLFFMQIVNIQGFEYNDYYDLYVYDLKRESFYLVNNEFPKLTKQNVPDAVGKVKYELALAQLIKFLHADIEG